MYDIYKTKNDPFEGQLKQRNSKLYAQSSKNFSSPNNISKKNLR